MDIVEVNCRQQPENKNQEGQRSAEVKHHVHQYAHFCLIAYLLGYRYRFCDTQKCLTRSIHFLQKLFPQSAIVSIVLSVNRFSTCTVFSRY